MSFGQLLSLSQLPLKFIDLRQGVNSVNNCPSILHLMDFAHEIKNKHKIDITIMTGSVLEWQKIRLNQNNKFDALEVVSLNF
ncbi:MAG: hypothetical protein H0U27_10570 [Nitrosopumilus sp.]|nr:hypothetical protein [Nitrosopumilus sp.]